jgi:glycosyltransferase involved in cell wall biosynthesis
MKKNTEYSLYTSTEFQKVGNELVIELFDDHQITLKNNVFVTNINDNYRFIRRFFNPAIGWYILVIRLVSFHNPVKELKGFFRSLKVKRVDIYKTNSWLILRDDYEAFDSALIRRQPKVSVIIPTLNRYHYLRDVLSDLEKQDYSNFEVIVCDQSDTFDVSFCEGWKLDLKMIRQEKKALWHARNIAIKVADGEYLAFSEDDVRVEPDWLSQHLKCVDYFEADISAGVFFPEDTEIPEHKSFFKWSDQFASGNAMMKKEFFTKTGLFDRQFEKQRGGDGEFGLRCYLLGFISISNPFAYCKDVKAATGGLRELGSWDSFRPTKLFAPRPVPSVLYLSRKYFGNHLSLLLLLFSVPSSIVPYRFKGNRWMKILSTFLFVVIWPFILVQVIMSWRQAGKKLKEGALIDKI